VKDRMSKIWDWLIMAEEGEVPPFCYFCILAPIVLIILIGMEGVI